MPSTQAYIGYTYFQKTLLRTSQVRFLRTSKVSGERAHAGCFPCRGKTLRTDARHELPEINSVSTAPSIGEPQAFTDTRVCDTLCSIVV